jgi:hypothetical protein
VLARQVTASADVVYMDSVSRRGSTGWAHFSYAYAPLDMRMDWPARYDGSL